MAKLRPYESGDPLDWYWLLITHVFSSEPFEPGAYHTIFPYSVYTNPPFALNYQIVPELIQDNGDLTAVLARGLIMAKDWASRPWMVQDNCPACHPWRDGPGLPRWNIYRGQPRLPAPSSLSPYAPYLPHCYVQRYDDPRPIGESV
jgi:hypothetical protein